MAHVAAAPPSTLRCAVLPRPSPTSERVAALWAAARSAQAGGDHERAAAALGRLVAFAPDDAEARLEHAIELGWAAPVGQSRLDEVIVGVGLAVEAARRGTRRAMRRRAARALTLLGEVRFDDAAEQEGALEGDAADRLVQLGLAALRALDVAAELDPACEATPRAVVRLCDTMIAAMTARSRLRAALSGLGVGKSAGVLEDLRVRRERALRHLAASPAPRR